MNRSTSPFASLMIAMWRILALLVLTTVISSCSFEDALDDLEKKAGAYVRGKIMDEAGPVINAVVNLKGLAGDLQTKTDANGNYEFANVADGQYQVKAEAQPATTDSEAAQDVTTPVQFTAETEIAVTGTTLNVQPLELTGAVAGAIVLGDSAGADGITDSTGIEIYVPGTSFAARTDANGRFTMLYIQPGKHPLRAERDGYESLDIKDVDVKSGQLTKIAGLVLNRKADTDGDGIFNDVDPDDDGDGVNDALDAFPFDISEQQDTDGDGIGDHKDVFFKGSLTAIDDGRTTFEVGFGNLTNLNDPLPTGFQSFECSLDDAAFSDCASAQVICTNQFCTQTRTVYRHKVGPLSNGSYNLKVRARITGLSPGSPVSWSWTVKSWTAISEGSSHTCGIRSDGTLWCWGLENNTTNCDPLNGGIDCEIPHQIGSATDWQSVSAGIRYACGIKTGGTLWCWGENDSGNLGDGTTTLRESPVQVGTDVNWLTVETGKSSFSVQTEPGSASGYNGSTTCALKTNGSLWCWGHNRSGSYAGGVTGTEACAYNGTHCNLTPVLNGHDTDWSSITLGGNHLCATKDNGSAWCWGDNSISQVGDGTRSFGIAPAHVTMPSSITTPADNWISSAAGSSSTCGLRNDNTIWCWGDASYSQLGTYWGDLYTGCPQGQGNETWCAPLPITVPVTASSAWLALAGARDGSGSDAGNQGFCAINSEVSGQELWCWGDIQGVLDGGSEPTRIEFGTAWNGSPIYVQSVALGRQHGCAIDVNGALWCWGQLKRMNGYVADPDISAPVQEDH